MSPTHTFSSPTFLKEEKKERKRSFSSFPLFFFLHGTFFDFFLFNVTKLITYYCYSVDETKISLDTSKAKKTTAKVGARGRPPGNPQRRSFKETAHYSMVAGSRADGQALNPMIIHPGSSASGDMFNTAPDWPCSTIGRDVTSPFAGMHFSYWSVSL